MHKTKRQKLFAKPVKRLKLKLRGIQWQIATETSFIKGRGRDGNFVKVSWLFPLGVEMFFQRKTENFDLGKGLS